MKNELKQLIKLEGEKMTITSVDLCKLINILRKEEKGEEAKELLHKTLMASIRSEIETLSNLGIAGKNILPSSYINSQNKTQPCFVLNDEGVLQILNKESTYVRYKTTQLVKELKEENKQLKEKVQDSYLIEDPIKRAERWIEEQKEKQRIEEENKILAPKADYTDRVLQAEGLITTTLIAKDFGLSARKLNDILNKEGVQYKQGKTWVLYSKYQDKGYSQTTTDKDGHVNMKWTQAGKKFIVELLQGLGYTLNNEK